MKSKKTIIVDSASNGIRLDKFLKEKLDIPFSLLHKELRKKSIKINKHNKIIVQVYRNRCISMLLESLYKNQQKSLYIVFFCKSLYKYRKEIVGNRHQKSL